MSAAQLPYGSPRYFFQQAYDLFRCGFDTVEIAQKLGIFESQVERLISIERAARHGYPSPYEGSR